MTVAGIFGRDSYVEGDNILVTNCGEYCLAMAYGGKCSFSHCTFGNYWDISTRTTPSLLLNNWYKLDDVTNIERDLTQADFYNCIIYGNLTNEVGLDSATTTGVAFNFKFSHCLMKTDIDTSNPSNFIINYLDDPQFANLAINDYRLGLNSPARNVGDLTTGTLYPFDLKNALRIADGMPDIGAYEGE